MRVLVSLHVAPWVALAIAFVIVVTVSYLIWTLWKPFARRRIRGLLEILEQVALKRQTVLAFFLFPGGRAAEEDRDAYRGGSAAVVSASGGHAVPRIRFLAGCFGAAAIALAGVLRLTWLSSSSFKDGGNLQLYDWFLSIYPDLMVFSGLVGLGALVGQRYAGAKGGGVGIFWGCASALVVTCNAYFLGVSDFSILMTLDSPGYLYRNACRQIGYLVLATAFKGVDERWLVVFQLNLVLAAQVAMAWAVLHLTRSIVAGVLTLFIATLFCRLYALSFFVLTEAVFAAAVGFTAAAAVAYIRSPSNWLAASVGLSTAAAIAMKAAAPALIIASACILMRPTSHRRMKFATVLGPPIVCLLALVAVGRIQNGSWSASNFSGYALADNVGWGIRSDRYSADPELSAAIEEKLAPLVRNWPSLWNPSEYVIYSMDNLDEMFWKTTRPLTSRKYVDTSDCPPVVNGALMRLAADAIVRDPARYAGHVAVQFYGLWAFALVPEKWVDQARQKMHGSTGPMLEQLWQAAPAHWRPTLERRLAIERGAANYEGRDLFLDRVKTVGAGIANIFGATPAVIRRSPASQSGGSAGSRSPQVIRMWQFFAGAFAGLTVVFSALALRMKHLGSDIAALVMLALLVNAYFGAQALFMFATPRYAACAEIPLAAFISILMFVVVRAGLSSQARAK